MDIYIGLWVNDQRSGSGIQTMQMVASIAVNENDHINGKGKMT